MSSLQTSLAKTIRSIDPIGYKVSKNIGDPGIKQLEKQEKMDREASAKDAAARTAYDEQLAALGRSTDVAARKQERGRAAAAAGATRSESDADLLGYVQRGAKRKSASRTILG
jgi:hypothetical protein